MLRFTFLVLATLSAFAQSNLEKDREAILAMAGSYVVDFHFKETVGFEPGYDLKKPKDAAAHEEVFVLASSERIIELQHVLQTKRGMVKHWRHAWEYEPNHIWEFTKEQTWERRVLSEDEARGKWIQRVYQTDDSPRYEALGTWSHIGNLSQWTSAPTRRPLPRREYTTREDYNVLIAQNRHAITPTGWVHEQDNYKLREDEKGSHVIAREFGLNRYDHTNPDKLAECRTWWEDNKDVWQDIRSVWQGIYQKESLLHIAAAFEEKPLHRHLGRLAEEKAAAKSYKRDDLRDEVKEIIQLFTEPQQEITKAEASD